MQCKRNMAKLAPKDPQFGIPVATRIREEMAFRLNREAEKAGKTLSLYLSEFMEMASANEKKIQELEIRLVKENELKLIEEKKLKETQTQLLREKGIAKRAAGRLIIEIAKGSEKKVNDLIQNYNSILKDEKSK